MTAEREAEIRDHWIWHGSGEKPAWWRLAEADVDALFAALDACRRERDTLDRLVDALGDSNDEIRRERDQWKDTAGEVKKLLNVIERERDELLASGDSLKAEAKIALAAHRGEQ